MNMLKTLDRDSNHEVQINFYYWERGQLGMNDEWIIDQIIFYDVSFKKQSMFNIEDKCYQIRGLKMFVHVF